ncbi:MAG TPA: APC family permease [Caulobacteraceae bacterium]|nr:APC family permease [Caulobacteraceae bacterium]
MSEPSGAAAAAGLQAFGYRQELRRSLSLLDLVVYGLLFISPTAPFPTFGIVFNESHGMVPLVYAVGLVAMLFTALSYMAMAHEFPVAGSVYSYAGRGIGESAGFLAGWAMLLDYALIPAGIYVICAVAIEAVIPNVPKEVWVVALLFVNTTINLLGIETAARMNTVLLTLQLLLLAAFLGLGIVALAQGVDGAHISLRPFLDPKTVTPALIFGALPVAALSFLGFDAISTLSEEARGGPRAVGQATMLALIVAAVLFIAQTWLASLFVLNLERFAPGGPTNVAFYQIVHAVGGAPFKFVVSIFGVLFGGTAAALVSQAGAGRLIYSMARDRRLPHALARVDPRRKIPTRAILLVAAITLALGLALVSQLELLLTVVSFGALTGFLLLHVSVVVHFIGRRKSRRWVRHLVLPACGAVIIGYVLISAETHAKIVGLCWMGAGVAIVAWLKLSGRLRVLPSQSG